MPGSSPTGVTRMLAPHPLEPTTEASCQRRPSANSAHALMHVRPGARLLSGLVAQARNRSRSRGSTPAGVRDGASHKAQATARAIWVSSVTRAGLPSSDTGPDGPYSATISDIDMNSVGLPKASPYANPYGLPLTVRTGWHPTATG